MRQIFEWATTAKDDLLIFFNVTFFKDIFDSHGVSVIISVLASVAAVLYLKSAVIKNDLVSY